MKEATGELNMTVVTIAAIAAVAALFYAFVWPIIRNNLNKNAQCASAYNCNCTGNSCACKYVDENGTEKDVTCSNSNAGTTTKK